MVTPHQTKLKKGIWDWYLTFYHTSIPRNSSTKEDRSAWIKMQDDKENQRLKLQIFILLSSMKSSLHMPSEK